MKICNENCSICGRDQWKIVYSGSIRDGVYGSIYNDASIYQCQKCGIQKLLESDCIPPEYYETGEYREKLNQSLALNSEIEEHELLNRFTFESIWPLSVRNKKVLDVGCGTGFLLDAVNNISKHQVGIEPCQPYLDSIIDKGYIGYQSIEDCIEQYGFNSFNLAFSIQVIEHVLNPKLFLEEILALLKPGADFIVSTPNRDDILMSLLPEDFPSFFYRTPHRWYFNSESLEFCARSAGFEVVETKYIHRYGMANTIRWLRDRQPAGMKKIKGIDMLADDLWKAYLESTHQSDNLYIHLRVPNNL
jgi:2-polyprenyl-3-methyl-5-hydroxy-6-metoxy-1,4-benzoquinol methylase